MKIISNVLTVSALALAVACGAASASPRFEDVSRTHLPPAPEAGTATMDAAAVDLDGDGDLDLVTPQEWRANRILINQGDGRFVLAADALPAPPEAELVRPEHITQPLQKDSEDVSIIDMDGDDRLDLVIVVEDDVRLGRANVHQYFRNAGAGRYERVYNVLPDSVANAVAHGDANGDGRIDLIISGDAQDRLLINQGDGRFVDETEQRLPREAAVAQDVEFFDADSDGDLDLVLGLEGGHTLWINDGRGVFADESRARLPIPGNVEARKVTPADVDRDGDFDLYFAHVSWQGRSAQDRLYINDGSGVFVDETAARLPADDRNSLDAAFADFDGDGDLDLVQGNTGSVRVLLNEHGRFTDITAQAIGSDIEGTSITIEVGDFDGDGRPDIFVGQLGLQNEGAADRLLLNRD